MNKIIQMIKQIYTKKITKYKWGILSGILVGTSYIPLPPWAVFFCYAPAWYFCFNFAQNKKEVFWNMWWTQFILTLIGFHWIAYVAHEFGSFPWILSVGALLLFASLMHLYIPLASLFAFWLQKKYNFNPMKAVYLNAFTLFFLEKYWPSIFPWHLGYTFFYAKIPLFHFADIVGFEGLSLYAFVMNAFVTHLVFLKQNQKSILKRAIFALGFFGVLNLIAIPYSKKWQSTDREINIAAIQGNIGNLDKVYAEKGLAFQDEITKKFLSLSKAAKDQFPDSEILIWPETAFPDYLNTYYMNNKTQRLLINGDQNTLGLKQINLPLLTGAYGKALKSDRGPRLTYNSIFLIGPDGVEFSPPYNKTHLLIFGEYLPLSETFPKLLELLPFIASFGRGNGPEILNLPRPLMSENNAGTMEITSFGTQICYEGLFPDFSSGLAKKGAQILANVTNDSWFGKPFEPMQHMYMTFARSIETRLPLVRSTNTGITSAILASGEILQQSTLHKEWVGRFNIKYQSKPELTFYVKHASKQTFLIFLIFIVLLSLSIYEKRRT